jgi:hypothetical protein
MASHRRQADRLLERVMLDEALAPYRWVAESLIGFKTDVVGSPPTK